MGFLTCTRRIAVKTSADLTFNVEESTATTLVRQPIGTV